MRTTRVIRSLLLVVLGMTGVARAAEPPPKPRTVEGSAGVRGAIGGNVFTTPTDSFGDGYGYRGNAGGVGWGVFGYAELRIVRHLGLQLDLGYDSAVLQRTVTINNVVKVQEKLSVGTLRFAVLVQGITPAPFGRLWIGIGPEFAFSPSADASNEITAGQQYFPSPSAITDTENAIHAEAVSSTYFDMAMGMVIEAGDLIEIPIDIRAAKNLSQEGGWQDRVNYVSALDYTVKAQSSWDFRFVLGLGARF